MILDKNISKNTLSDTARLEFFLSGEVYLL